MIFLKAPDFTKILRKYLQNNYPLLPDVELFIKTRNMEAMCRYLSVFNKTKDKDMAYLQAMEVLLQGYAFSRYEYVENILLEYFPNKINWRKRTRCIRDFVIRLEPVFELYKVEESSDALEHAVVKYLSEN